MCWRNSSGRLGGEPVDRDRTCEALQPSLAVGDLLLRSGWRDSCIRQPSIPSTALDDWLPLDPATNLSRMIWGRGVLPFDVSGRVRRVCAHKSSMVDRSRVPLTCSDDPRGSGRPGSRSIQLYPSFESQGSLMTSNPQSADSVSTGAAAWSELPRIMDTPVSPWRTVLRQFGFGAVVSAILWLLGHHAPAVVVLVIAGSVSIVCALSARCRQSRGPCHSRGDFDRRTRLELRPAWDTRVPSFYADCGISVARPSRSSGSWVVAELDVPLAPALLRRSSTALSTAVHL